MQRQCMCALLLLLAIGTFVFPIDACAQNNAVRWSTFDMGFAVPSSSNTRVKSAVGQSFVGATRILNNWIDSGFLADTLLRGTVTAIREDGQAGIPSTYELRQNYPNPFNPSTTVKYTLPIASTVELKVYNVVGQEVVTLVNESQDPGYYSVTFNATNVSSGVYFYRIRAGQFVEVRRLMVLK